MGDKEISNQIRREEESVSEAECVALTGPHVHRAQVKQSIIRPSDDFGLQKRISIFVCIRFGGSFLVEIAFSKSNRTGNGTDSSPTSLCALGRNYEISYVSAYWLASKRFSSLTVDSCFRIRATFICPSIMPHFPWMLNGICNKLLLFKWARSPRPEGEV